MPDLDKAEQRWAVFHGSSVRDRLEAALRVDLLGPSEECEVLSQSPRTRYLVGMLAPAGTTLEVAEDEGIATADKDEVDDSGAVAHTALDQSSIGLSFVVTGDCDEVEVALSWGEYLKETNEDGVNSDSGGTSASTKEVWRRFPVEAIEVVPTAATRAHRCREVGEGVELVWASRAIGDCHVVSVFLSNKRQAPATGRAPDDLWLFQPQIRVTAPNASIQGRSGLRTAADPEPDIASADLLYRDLSEFATGHGVAADWDEPKDGSARIASVWTDVIPRFEVPAVTQGGADGVDRAKIAELAQADAETTSALLTPILDAYAAWLDQRHAEVDLVAAPDQDVAASHVSSGRHSLDRMREGLSLLCSDEDALRAFQFANQAIYDQMVRSIITRAKRGRALPDTVKNGEEPTWHLFQIGFILKCLPSLVNPDHEDREVADLLWFPTGGGKTEAYLGLTAFTLAYRRLRSRRGEIATGAGTAVVMRYTLRLLTTQQFQRALAMICACEALRRDDEETWGSERFTIGLWVGLNVTPNGFKEAIESLDVLKRGHRVFKNNPYQVVYCPWCGEDLAPKDYFCDEVTERTKVTCPSKACDFNGSHHGDGLPVLLVDAEIYRDPPSLLLATVDKFASMPWNGRVQALFGRVQRFCARHGYLSASENHPQEAHRANGVYPAVEVTDVKASLEPPELIIQDELHLISGPLGTLVGIYEVAVDTLCRAGLQASKGAKVIASTATIRRAKQQVESLFGRDVEVFPSLGLTYDDSFFARRAAPTEKPGRLYLGVYAPGRSVKTALVRVYADLLSRAEVEFANAEAADRDIAESYMTLVGYFNSIRELGGALRLVEDDVDARLKVLNSRGFGPKRRIYETRELTSRISSGDIPEVLARLERQFHSREQGNYPIDVLLASNMIQVGVDIDRLGAMVVTGQPKSTAEYIQATSRVGRRHPGIVVTVYNWSRPRDTSHYETFRHYHETFYRHVEATSVTPFSARARDRALAAALVSYVRLDGDDSKETAASNFSSSSESSKRVHDALLSRAKETTGRDDVVEETDLQIRSLKQQWADLASAEDLVYHYGGERPRLLSDLAKPSSRGLWPTSRSLREVEPELKVVLRKAPDEE